MIYISKSNFMNGLDCHRKLWQALWGKEELSVQDDMTKFILNNGNKFGILAHSLFPNAKLIHIDTRNLDAAVNETKEEIEKGTKVILEAAFVFGRCRVLSDVVERLEDGSWHLIEVKSSTKDKPEHYIDLAYQKYVMENVGYKVSKCSVIHANKEGVWPDIESIFKTVDVTEKVSLESESINSKIESLLAITEDNPPDLIESYSKKCSDCGYKKVSCWKDINEPTIYDVINKGYISELKSNNILYLNGIPNDFKLNKKDRENTNRVNQQKIEINNDAISKSLAELQYPIYFLDFETVTTPIPLFDGVHPWEKLVFQYSLHIQNEEGGAITHKEYLHQELTEPSKSVAEKLVSDIGEEGSIVVYSKSMEIGVISDLANRFPDLSSKFESMVSRVWDLSDIFKNYYRDWRFGTKWSIKVVLPILCPSLSYDELAVHDGGGACKGWIDMLEMTDKEEKAKELLEYCKLDTLAMVELLKKLYQEV